MIMPMGAHLGLPGISQSKIFREVFVVAALLVLAQCVLSHNAYRELNHRTSDPSIILSASDASLAERLMGKTWTAGKDSRAHGYTPEGRATGKFKGKEELYIAEVLRNLTVNHSHFQKSRKPRKSRAARYARST